MAFHRHKIVYGKLNRQSHQYERLTQKLATSSVHYEPLARISVNVHILCIAGYGDLKLDDLR